MGLGGPASLIEWNPQRCPSLVFIGKSGAGKSTAAQIALGRVKRYVKGPGARATICDFKSEYTYLSGCAGRFDHDRCLEGLRSFAAENERRIREGVTDFDPFYVLLFSEWGMFCSMSDKRIREMSAPFQNVIFRRNGMSLFAGWHTCVMQPYTPANLPA